MATEDSALTRKVKKEDVLVVPIAHAEGNYYADQETIESMEKNNQVLFRYCDSNGSITSESNPNGSINNIAGICNEGRNVFGMMPHPERCANDDLFNEDGKILFESIMSACVPA